eukprot:364999-Chlamydomonas_euryale.AAC.20
MHACIFRSLFRSLPPSQPLCNSTHAPPCTSPRTALSAFSCHDPNTTSRTAALATSGGGSGARARSQSPRVRPCSCSWPSVTYSAYTSMSATYLWPSALGCTMLLALPTGKMA